MKLATDLLQSPESFDEQTNEPSAQDGPVAALAPPAPPQPSILSSVEDPVSASVRLTVDEEDSELTSGGQVVVKFEFLSG